MRCPRCQRASPDEAVFCPGCGAPLAFRAEPTPRPLDLSISLDRRAGRELSLDPLHEAARAAAWDLGAAPARSLPGAFHAEDDELEFGPVPELAPDLEPGPGPALAEVAVRAAREPAPGPGPVDPAEAPERPLARALGLAPDPVVPDDLGLPDGPPGERREPDLVLRGAPAGADAGPVLDRELDLALDVQGRPEAERDLDVSLPPSAQPDQLPLPLRDVGPRLRGARPVRRAAAWAVDAAPLGLLWVGGLSALYDRVPLSPGDHAGLLERVLRDGGALALPLLAVVATLALVHQTVAHALAGATLGKWLLGLRVVSEVGERPSVGRCAARAGLSAASVLLLGLGLLPALFTRSGRALHDISAGTRVVESP